MSFDPKKAMLAVVGLKTKIIKHGATAADVKAAFALAEAAITAYGVTVELINNLTTHEHPLAGMPEITPDVCNWCNMRRTVGLSSPLDTYEARKN